MINELETENIISIDKNSYNAVNISKSDLSDEDIKILFANIIQRKMQKHRF